MSLSTAPLTSCQEKALDVLQRQGNVFLTGAAGTGKSFLLDRYLQGKSSDEFPIVASTGAAAVIVGGRTFHSFFGLGIMEGGLEMTITRALRSRKLVRRLQRACCVIIDEVSMLSGMTLFAAECIACRVRGNGEPWGGLRIIAVGDFAQLPPVTPGMSGKDWAFLHDVWHASNFQPALLSTVMRTQDVSFLEILNFVREGIVNDRVHEFLNERTVSSLDSEEGTRLYPHRAQADQYNLRRLEALPEREHAYATEYIGHERYLQSAKRAIPLPDTLLLKKGALIMMRKNDSTGQMRYVNGSLGHIRQLGNDTLHVDLFSGETIEVGKEKFSCLDGDGNEIMAAWNFPVSLAWATTIHKAQGASLDRMIVDLHQLWEPGQAYVALSRVRSGAGLKVERWSPGSIRAERLVTQFYNSLVDQAQKYTPQPYFVSPELPKEEADAEKESALSMSERISLTQRMIEAREDFSAISAACGVTMGTVVKYIERIIERGEPLDLRYLLAEIEDVDRIRSLFREHGLEFMKPVFESLEGAVSYDTLRLVRLAMIGDRARATMEVG